MSVTNNLLIIDNYDSFTFNIVQEISKVGVKNISVLRNDDPQLIDINYISNFTHLIISPGPGSPLKDSGNSPFVLKELIGKIPILGICLGHQLICEFAGQKVINASQIVHGKPSEIVLTDSGKSSQLFNGVNNGEKVARYHSLTAFSPINDVAKANGLVELANLGIESNSEIMAVELKVDSRSIACYGVQFHPESILSDCGLQILKNFALINSV